MSYRSKLRARKPKPVNFDLLDDVLEDTTDEYGIGLEQYPGEPPDSPLSDPPLSSDEEDGNEELEYEGDNEEPEYPPWPRTTEPPARPVVSSPQEDGDAAMIFVEMANGHSGTKVDASRYPEEDARAARNLLLMRYGSSERKPSDSRIDIDEVQSKAAAGSARSRAEYHSGTAYYNRTFKRPTAFSPARLPSPPRAYVEALTPPKAVPLKQGAQKGKSSVSRTERRSESGAKKGKSPTPRSSDTDRAREESDSSFSEYYGSDAESSSESDVGSILDADELMTMSDADFLGVVEKHSIEEIADVLDQQRDSVKRRINRAIPAVAKAKGQTAEEFKAQFDKRRVANGVLSQKSVNMAAGHARSIKEGKRA